MAGDDTDGKSRDAAPAPAGEASEARGHDVALVHGVTEDGAGLRVLRSRPDRLEQAVLRGVKEGQPLTGELVRLRPRKGSPLLWDVETLYDRREEQGDSSEPRSSRAAGSGPAQVATDAYRRNWEAVFQTKPKPTPN
jgi:hypothetical protein